MDYTYATTNTSGAGDFALVLLPIILVCLVIALINIVALWRIFKKAGRPGWAAIIPVYSSWVLFEIVGYPGWWALLSLVPVVNIFPFVMSLIAYFKLAKLFGKSDGFAVMNVVFGFITLPILAFGKSQFQNGGDNANNNSAGSSGPVAADTATAYSPTETIQPITQSPIATETGDPPLQAPAQPIVVSGETIKPESVASPIQLDITAPTETTQQNESPSLETNESQESSDEQLPPSAPTS